METGGGSLNDGKICLEELEDVRWIFYSPCAANARIANCLGMGCRVVPLEANRRPESVSTS